MNLTSPIISTMANPLSRTEISFIRLLARCENYVPEREPNEWRLEQYVKNLEERLLELKKMNTCQPSKDTLADYTRRVEFLKGIVEAEKMIYIEESSVVATTYLFNIALTIQSALTKDLHVRSETAPSVTEKALANQLLSPGTFTPTSNKLHQQTKAHYLREMREELLGTKEDSSSTSDRLRMRNINANSPADDFDAVMQYHNSMQEKVAQEMMSLVQNLKQNSLIAGHIIRKDTDALRSSTSMADDRYSELKVQSEKLEVHAKKSCNWCVWIMLAAVCLIFMWMIVFIRLFPKR